MTRNVSLLAVLVLAFGGANTAFAVGGEVNHLPVCVDGFTHVVPCEGATTTATLDGNASYDPDGDPITFFWQSCPGSFVTDPTAPITQLVIDTSNNCNIVCGVRVRVTDSHGAYSACRQYVQVVPGGEGCSPGYWKNHPESWVGTGYAPGDDFDTVFGANAFTPNRTLMTALQTGGGGLNKLGRMAVSALLNAAHAGVNAPHSIGYYLGAVRAAILSGQYEPLATQLDADANLGCPLN